MNQATKARIGAAIIGFSTIMTGLPATAQEGDRIGQAQGAVDLENFSLRGRNGERGEEMTFNFRTYRDACGIHYTIDGDDVSQYLYETRKQALKIFKTFNLPSGATAMMRRSARTAEVNRLLHPGKTKFEAAISSLEVGELERYEHYLVNGKHVYFVDGELATEQEFNAKKVWWSNVVRNKRVQITPGHVR